MIKLNKNAQEVRNDMDLTKVTTEMCDGEVALAEAEAHRELQVWHDSGIRWWSIDNAQSYQRELKALGKTDVVSGSLLINLRKVASRCYFPTFMGVSSNDKISSSNLEDVGLIPTAPANSLTISTGDKIA